MDTFSSPLVLTKILIPTFQPRIISRQRLLVDMALCNSGKDVIVVCAPAGYGKTTLLVDWTQSLIRDGKAVAWVGLDPGDDEVIPFSTYLVGSLSSCIISSPELTYLTQLLRTSPKIDIQRTIETVINAILTYGQECVVILDDYHLITSPEIHNAIAYLLEHLPPNMRVAISSRSDPPLPLARLRARGYLLEIRAADLRFSTDEAELFLNQKMNLELSPEEIRSLEDRTEGWAVGLQLAGLSLKGRTDKGNYIDSYSGNQRYLADYLMDEVVNRQTEEVQSFLFTTSILERMCAPLCDAVLGLQSQSEAVLQQLLQANLFVVPLDDQGYWYRYHHLFRDFLQTRYVKKEPEKVKNLHKAASEWLADHHLLREAVQQAFLTGDLEYAAAFIEQHSFDMIVHSEISTLYEWCSTFPEEFMQSHPWLCIHQCWGLVFSFQRQDHQRIEARLQQVEQLINSMENKQQADDLMDNIDVIRTLSAMAPDPLIKPEKQLELSQRMKEKYPEGNPGQFSALLTTGYALMALHDVRAATKTLETARQTALQGQLYYGIVESTYHLSRLAYSQGYLDQSIMLCQQGKKDIAVKLTRPEQELPALGCLDIAAGCAYLEQNNLDEAEKCLKHGLDMIGMGMNPHYLMTGYSALVRLFEIEDRSTEAEIYLRRLEGSWGDIAFYTEGIRVSLALRSVPRDSMALVKAGRWSENFISSLGQQIPIPGLGPYGASEVYYLSLLAWFRILIATGQSQAVLENLKPQLNRAMSNQITSRVIELSLLEAQAAYIENKNQQTWVALERALEAGQSAGFINSFNQGPALFSLLTQAEKKGICSNYVRKILASISLTTNVHPKAFATLPSAPRSELELIENLSQREIEILHLMAQGASNQEIAEQLVITVGTVKSHINHILGKLNAHNRTEAVAKARKLGLVSV